MLRNKVQPILLYYFFEDLIWQNKFERIDLFGL